MVTDRVLEYLRKKAKRQSAFNGRGLVDRIARDLRCDRTDVRRAFRDLRERDLLRCDNWAGPEPLSKVTLALPDEPTPGAERWREVLGASGLGLGEIAGLGELGELGEVLEGMERQDLSRLLQGLVRLRDDLDEQSGQPRFEVSARYLLGSSKLLDALPSAPLRRFGIDPARFPAFPGYVMVAGPADPAAVILVENPHAFERALEAEGTEEAAWVCTFGYGLSLRRSQYGEQLAAMLESGRAPLTLNRMGDPPDWEVLLDHERIRFWGDLDLEGLAIFQRLRRHNPRIALSGIYQPMVEQLRAGGGHPYCEMVGKAGQSPPEYGTDLASLVELCRHQALDQEWVEGPLISLWWPKSLRT